LKQIIVRVPEELHKSIKLQSFQSGVSMQDAVTQFLTQWAEGRVELKSSVRISQNKSKVNDEEKKHDSPVDEKPKVEEKPKVTEKKSKSIVDKEEKYHDIGSPLDRWSNAEKKVQSKSKEEKPNFVVEDKFEPSDNESRVLSEDERAREFEKQLDQLSNNIANKVKKIKGN
jgi:hypothetical protein